MRQCVQQEAADVYMSPAAGPRFLSLLSFTFPVCVGVGGEGVVNGPDDLVHALHVGDARVQLGVDEQDSLHHLPVRLAAVRQNLVLVGRIQVQRLAWGAHLGVKGQSEAKEVQPDENNKKIELPEQHKLFRAEQSGTVMCLF